jgi:hypothetical protein
MDAAGSRKVPAAFGSAGCAALHLTVRTTDNIIMHIQLTQEVNDVGLDHNRSAAN